jgi:hypothetical protein
LRHFVNQPDQAGAFIREQHRGLKSQRAGNGDSLQQSSE